MNPAASSDARIDARATTPVGTPLFAVPTGRGGRASRRSGLRRCESGGPPHSDGRASATLDRPPKPDGSIDPGALGLERVAARRRRESKIETGTKFEIANEFVEAVIIDAVELPDKAQAKRLWGEGVYRHGYKHVVIYLEPGEGAKAHIVHLWRQRYRLADGRTAMLPTPAFLDPEVGFEKDLVAYVSKNLREGASLRTLSRQTGAPRSRLKRVLARTRAADEAARAADGFAPIMACADETHLSGRGARRQALFVGIASDLTRPKNHVAHLAVIPRNKKVRARVVNATVGNPDAMAPAASRSETGQGEAAILDTPLGRACLEFLRKITDRSRLVSITTDYEVPIRRAMKAALEHLGPSVAQIGLVIDRRHVLDRFSFRLDERITREIQGLRKTIRTNKLKADSETARRERWLTRNRRLLLEHPRVLARSRAKLATFFALCHAFPDLGAAARAHQRLLYLYDAPSRAQADQRLAAWDDRLGAAAPIYAGAREYLERNRDDVLAFFTVIEEARRRHGIIMHPTSGPAEGMNAAINKIWNESRQQCNDTFFDKIYRSLGYVAQSTVNNKPPITWPMSFGQWKRVVRDSASMAHEIIAQILDPAMPFPEIPTESSGE